MPRALIATAVALAALSAGCSSDSDQANTDPVPTSSPSSPSTSPSSDEPSDLTPSAEPQQPTDPIEFYSSGRSCVEYPGPDLLLSEEIKVSRRLKLDGAELQDLRGDIELGRPTYVAVPRGEVPLTGSWAGTAPTKKQWDRTGWLDRKPLTGAEVPPGRYYVYFPIELTGPGRYSGIAVDWTDEAGSGTSVWDTRDIYRPHCR